MQLILNVVWFWSSKMCNFDPQCMLTMIINADCSWSSMSIDLDCQCNLIIKGKVTALCSEYLPWAEAVSYQHQSNQQYTETNHRRGSYNPRLVKRLHRRISNHKIKFSFLDGFFLGRQSFLQLARRQTCRGSCGVWWVANPESDLYALIDPNDIDDDDVFRSKVKCINFI